MMTDPIADMLTRIRNASIINKPEICVPFSKIKLGIANLLVKAGYLSDVQEKKDIHPYIWIALKYNNKQPAISHIKRINIPSYMVQDQHDTYFLLQDTPGEVAKKLNSISGLDIIDGTLKNISSMERECGRELKRIKGEIEEEQISLDKLNFLDNAAPLIEGINIEYKEMVNFKGILDSLLGIQSSHAAIIGELGVIKGWLRVEGLYLDIKQEMDQRGKLQGELELLQLLSDQIGNYSVRVKELSGWLEVEKDRNELLELLEKKTGLAIKLSELQRQLKAAEETESSLGNAQDRLKEKKERYKGLLVDSMICPWCGGQVDEESLERHLGEVL